MNDAAKQRVLHIAAAALEQVVQQPELEQARLGTCGMLIETREDMNAYGHVALTNQCRQTTQACIDFIGCNLPCLPKCWGPLVLLSCCSRAAAAGGRTQGEATQHAQRRP